MTKMDIPLQIFMRDKRKIDICLLIIGGGQIPF